MPENLTVDIRPLREADGPVSVVARAIEITPNGVSDLIDALKLGMPVYEADGTYLVSVARLVEAAEIKRLERLE